jgi:hypothetical protein
MEMSLTQAQKDFIHGLKLFGCSRTQALVMTAHMWHPDDLQEMLNYMVDHLDSTPAQLYDVCLKISSRRKQPEEWETAEE